MFSMLIFSSSPSFVKQVLKSWTGPGNSFVTLIRFFSGNNLAFSVFSFFVQAEFHLKGEYNPALKKKKKNKKKKAGKGQEKWVVLNF